MLKFVRRVKNKIHRALKSCVDRYFWGLPPIEPHNFSAELIAKLLDAPRPFILEIGSNDGEDTTRMLKAMPQASINCFEPEPRALTKLIARLGNDPRVKIHPIAISSCDGTSVFHQSSGGPGGEWDYSGSTRPPKKHLTHHPEITFASQISVRTRSLDSWASENGVETVDFIWMDVQGAELDVFQGAVATLKRTRFIYTEYYDLEMYEGQKPLRLLLKSLPGFKIMHRYENDVLLQNTSMLR
jgi:FkbM family methyltransferase